MAKLILGDRREKVVTVGGGEVDWEGSQESLGWAANVLALDLDDGGMCVHENLTEL